MLYFHKTTYLHRFPRQGTRDQDVGCPTNHRRTTAVPCYIYRTPNPPLLSRTKSFPQNIFLTTKLIWAPCYPGSNLRFFRTRSSKVQLQWGNSLKHYIGARAAWSSHWKLYTLGFSEATLRNAHRDEVGDRVKPGKQIDTCSP